jgi:hypothetical protein
MDQKPKTQKRLELLRNESGAVVVLVAILLTVFLAIAALAIDVGYLASVRNELQNAADASALAGARAFAESSSPTPNWTLAAATAQSSISINKSAGITLTDIEVETGYWNLARSPLGLQSTGITPGANDVAAVKARVNKADGSNSGKVQHWFGAFAGKGSSNVSADAVAVCGYAGAAGSGALPAPFAISDCTSDNMDPGETFRIGSAYHYPDDEAGQFTTFLVALNQVPAIRDLITNGNPSPVEIGDNVWIQPGTENSLYEHNNHPSMNDFAGKTIVVPVVSRCDLQNRGWAAVSGFACLHVVRAVGASQKYVEAYLVDPCVAPGTEPGGPNYGAYAPPKLVWGGGPLLP